MSFFRERKNLLIILAGIIIILLIILGNLAFNKGGFKGGSKSTQKGGNLPLSGNLNPEDVSPISGISCENAKKRPMAVMVASDPITRPLSGMSEADLVVEMPVLTSDVTRLMAVYICGAPEEIGSVRSARHDYLWLDLGMDAILAHWGGSYHVLNLLNLDPVVSKIADDIDALTDPYGTFWRKSNLPAPYNGFTGMSKLRETAEKLKFRTTDKFEGYPHGDEIALNSRPSGGTLLVGYPGTMEVKYQYDKNTNSYLRIWGGKEDTDFNNGKRIAAKNVVVMFANQRLMKPGEQYNDVDVEGEGQVKVYENGGVVEGTWKKDIINKQSKLYFYNNKGEEIKFVPGQIWLEIIEPFREVNWTPAS